MGVLFRSCLGHLRSRLRSLVVVVVCWWLVIHRILVARWILAVGSSPTVVVRVRSLDCGSCGALELGTPIPLTDSELTSAGRPDRTRQPGTRPNSNSQLAYPPRLEGPNKGRLAPFLFGCVCLSVASLISRIA